MKTLVLGCGHSEVDNNKDVVCLDINPECNPDVVWDITKHPLPFEDETFDSIVAIEVLEHLAQQGDAEFFFREFEEYWRILKPEGHFTARSPLAGTKWVWGDPGHKRVIQKEQLIFLDLDSYKQCGKTAMCDYRYLYKKGNFKVTRILEENGHFMFTLQKKAIGGKNERTRVERGCEVGT